MLTEAVAAAILNHPAFVTASADSPREDTITIQTRNDIRYLLVLEFARTDTDGQEQPTPAAEVAYAADRLLTDDPSDRDRAVAGLLNYVAATWDRQDAPLREHAQAVTRTLAR